MSDDTTSSPPAPPAKHGWGWRPQTPDPRDYRIAPKPQTLRGLRPFADLRASFPYAPLDQGRIGSCTAFAWSAAFSVARKRAGRRLWKPSPLFLYWCERDAEGTVGTDAGATMRTGAKAISAFGIPGESFWPYDDTPAASDGTWKPSARPRKKPGATAFAAAADYQGLTFFTVGQNPVSLRGMLSEGWPITFGIVVYSSLFDRLTGLPRSVVPMPRLDRDDPLGGHAVCLAGYNDGPGAADLGSGHELPERHFLVRNSWGESQQMGGYFALPYDYVLNADLAADFGAIQQVEK